MRCSFCGKRKDEVTRLVAGPGVFICDRCVALCNEIISQPPSPSTPEPQGPKWVTSTALWTRWWRRMFRIEALEPV